MASTTSHLEQWKQHFLQDVSQKLETSIEEDSLTQVGEGIDIYCRDAALHILDQILAILFPGVHGVSCKPQKPLKAFLEKQIQAVLPALSEQVERVLRYAAQKAALSGEEGHMPSPLTQNQEGVSIEEISQKITTEFIQELPQIREYLLMDIAAAYEGDPAAISMDEVLTSYPCVEAIATYRLAHALYRRGVPILPRILSERAHSRTGIDIHPGATIGPSFFIDHGTGVVIGETTVIGKSVKIYQGVTLGALSFPKDDEGKPIKGIKRHPNIEDDVIIYAGATVLGGSTTIGKKSIVGGNCWVTDSVPPNTLVSVEVSHSKMQKLSSQSK